MSTSTSLESLQKKIELFWRTREKRLGPRAPSVYCERITLIKTAEALGHDFFFATEVWLLLLPVVTKVPRPACFAGSINLLLKQVLLSVQWKPM